MKSLKDYTAEEKIKLFDYAHDSCLNEFNESAGDEEHDEHYFWLDDCEDIISEILCLVSDDWDRHNAGEEIEPEKPEEKPNYEL